LQEPNIFAIDAIQYNWDGSKQVHLATRLAKKPEGEMGCAIVPALYVNQEHCDRPSAVLMSSAANMLARKAMFQALGGFDERLLFGYEDIELCWRAWARGWKSVLAPAAICWHRVGGSTQSLEGARLAFRGVLGGRLLIAAKLMPVSYLVRTWLSYLGGLTMDLLHLRVQRASDRIAVLRGNVQCLATLLCDRRKIYGLAGIAPAEQMECLLQLSSGAK
jgi:GT2 family glycosyltransferase